MHRSHILAATLVAFLCGVSIELPFFLFVFFAIALGGALTATFFTRHAFIVVWCLFGFLIGILRGSGGAISFPLVHDVANFFENARESFVENISHALPEPYAAYISGLLTGARSRIPYDLKQAFQKTGTAHLIAVSGYNVTIIAQYIEYLSRSMVAAGVGIIVFVFFAGMSSSVVRAAIMGLLVLAAKNTGHNYHALRALLYAASVMVFVEPSIMWHDIGFQLSVAATAGLLILAPKIYALFGRMPKAFGFREALSTTLAAEAATFPLIIFYFGAFSLFAPMVNMLILPMVPLTMFFGFITGLAGYIHPWLAIVLAWPGYLLAFCQISIITFFADINVF